MNSFPDDDPRLVEFLRQHKPVAPSAASNLEDQILAAIETTPQELATTPSTLQPGSQPRTGWVARSRLVKFSVGLAAGIVATVVGYQMLIPPQPSEAEIAELEAFIQGTWHGTVADSPADEQILPPPDSSIN